MVAASRWAAGGAWNVALANHDIFPLGEIVRMAAAALVEEYY